MGEMHAIFSGAKFGCVAHMVRCVVELCCPDAGNSSIRHLCLHHPAPQGSLRESALLDSYAVGALESSFSAEKDENVSLGASRRNP